MNPACECVLKADVSELSKRQRQVLSLLLSGVSERQLAERIELSAGTVHKYVTSIYRYFGVTTRAELMALWIPTRRNGRFPWEEPE